MKSNFRYHARETFKSNVGDFLCIGMLFPTIQRAGFSNVKQLELDTHDLSWNSV